MKRIARSRRALRRAIAVLSLLLLSSAAPGLDWEAERVDTSARGYDPALALDAQGKPHISFFGLVAGQDNHFLKYATLVGGAWHIQVLDDTGSPHASNGTSIAADSQSRPHISYHRMGPDNLGYAYHDGSGWVVETPDAAYGSGRSSSIAVTHNGEARICYNDNSTVSLAFAERHTAWEKELVAGNYTGCGTPHGLALDADDAPHIAAFHQGSVGHAFRSVSGWNLDFFGGGIAGSIGLDRDGNPRIAYLHNHTVYCARREGMDWVIDALSTARATGASLAVDRGGLPHVTYWEQGEQEYHLMYARFDGVSWRIEDTGFEREGMAGSSLALDGAGLPHVTFFGSPHGVYYAVGVPEPATLALLALGGLALIRRSRRKQRP